MPLLIEDDRVGIFIDADTTLQPLPRFLGSSAGYAKERHYCLFLYQRLAHAHQGALARVAMHAFIAAAGRQRNSTPSPMKIIERGRTSRRSYYYH